MESGPPANASSNYKQNTLFHRSFIRNGYNHYQLPKINKIKIVCDLNYGWMLGNYLAFTLAQNKAIAHV